MTFGGSVQSWIHREVVERLGWIDNKAFLSGMTVAQVLPGVPASRCARRRRR